MSRAEPQPTFVLVRPQLGENIGASARAMWNFGLDRMRLVAPRDGWPNPTSGPMASGARRVLNAAVLFDRLADAVADCSLVLVTTARKRDLTKPVMTPEQAMALAAKCIGEGERVAVVFGPERAGLENKDVARATAIVTVPANPEYFSLNLGQCVLLMAYEWQRQSGSAGGGVIPGYGMTWADSAEVEALANHFEERLDDAGFFFPPEKADGMKINLRNFWGRIRLTRADTRMLHGIMRQMVRWKERRD